MWYLQVLKNLLVKYFSSSQYIRIVSFTMRCYVFLGLVAVVVASPAPVPQNFDANKVAAILVSLNKGPPVGVGPAVETGVYDQDAALATASAAASIAMTAAAANKRNLDDRRWINADSRPTSTAAATLAPWTTPPNVTSVPVPSTCTPVSWTNTFAFTSDTACPTPIEVGTYCGFINPEDPCAPQPAGYGRPTTPDTVEAFQNNPAYHQEAQDAKTTSGYTRTFMDLNAAVNANSYLGFKQLYSYDVAGCASFCGVTDLCTGFNVYIERDPAWNPDQCSCTNPTSMTNYKCSIWDSGVTKDAATNAGQARDDFQVIVVGSNGYEAATPPPTPPKWQNPQNCGGKLHDKPRYCLGQQSFPGPFDASLCAAYATQQNTVNKKAGLISAILSLLGYSPGKSVQFQAAELKSDGAAWGTHCRIFSKRFDKGQASLDLGASGLKWACGKSYTFDLA
jgi:hypothetical protein